MSYVTVESEGVSYRAIFGTHLFPTPAHQLPVNCDAIILEGATNTPNLMYDALMGVPRVARSAFGIQYDPIRELASRGQIPLIAGEPLAQSEALLIMAYKEARRRDLFFRNPYLAVAGMWALLSLASSDKEVDENSGLFRLAKRAAQFNEAVNVGGNPVSLKDNLLAQTAHAYVNHQRQRGHNDVSTVAVVGGSLHVGLVDALKRSTGDRVTAIADDSRRDKYYQYPTFGTRHVVIFDSRKHKSRWKKESFVDPDLARIKRK